MGMIRSGVLSSVRGAPIYRASVTFTDTGATKTNAIVDVSRFSGEMPEDGDIGMFYTEDRYYYSLISIIGRVADKSPSDMLSDGSEHDAGIPHLEPGSSFFGRRGHIFSDSNGNMEMKTEQLGAKVVLKSNEGRARVFGREWGVSSFGEGVSLRATSSTGATPADRFDLTVGAVVPDTEDASGQMPVTIPLTNFSISPAGAVELKRGVSGSYASLTMSAINQIKLDNVKASITMSSTGAVSLVATLACSISAGTTASLSSQSGMSLSDAASIIASAPSISLNAASSASTLIMTSESLEAKSGSSTVTVSPAGNEIVGQTTVTGASTFNGVATFNTGVQIHTALGIPAFLPTPPLALTGTPTGITVIGRLPVFISGVPVGFIPITL